MLPRLVAGVLVEQIMEKDVDYTTVTLLLSEKEAMLWKGRKSLVSGEQITEISNVFVPTKTTPNGL